MVCRGCGGRGMQCATGAPFAATLRRSRRLPRRWSGWWSRIAQDPEVGQDTPHDSRIVDRRDDAHPATIVRTRQHAAGAGRSTPRLVDARAPRSHSLASHPRSRQPARRQGNPGPRIGERGEPLAEPRRRPGPADRTCTHGPAP
jgi:hypothetical protein